MLTLTKFPNRYVLDENGKRIRIHFYPDEWHYETNGYYPCAPARRWMRDQAKKGLTAKEIWEKCENSEWICWILTKFGIRSNAWWNLYGYSASELRAMVKWKDIRNALIKHGWR